MKNCPRCSFLMDDHETVCATCSEQERPARVAAEEPIASVLQSSATAVLERPTVVPLSESTTFRPAGSGTVPVKGLVMGAVLAAALTVAVVMGLRHEGPLAGTLAQIGLIDPPTVVVPDQWVPLNSATGGFTVAMPAGAVDVVEHPELVGTQMAGYVVDLGPDARMMAVSTDFGRGESAIAEYDTDAGFSALVDWYVATAGLGAETVRREVQVSHGRALDAVLVRDDELTTRARFLLIGDRLVVLQTTGPDSGAAVLDEAHPKLVDSFDAI